MPLDRIGDWNKFSNQVAKHVEQYTIPQYQSDDDQSDQVGIWSVDDCLKAIQRYLSRAGKGSRGLIEQQRDFIKIAHYAQFAYDKFKDQNGMVDIYE